MFIDNSLRSIFITADNLLNEYTKLSANVAIGDTSLKVINTAGFNSKSAYIGDIGADRSEITQINSVSSNEIFCDAVIQTHNNRDKVYLMEYNQINLYKNNTLINTITIKADYYTRIDTSIDKDAVYYITFENSTDESEKREELFGYERNLCSVSDIYAYDKPDNLSFNLLSKIDLASKEIRNLFINQEQEFTDLSNNEVELLRQPTALLALYYAWTELIKNKEDIATLKASKYKDLYDQKLSEVLSVISKKNDNIRIFGQTQMER
jgi:hypothetical protein